MPARPTLAERLAKWKREHKQEPTPPADESTPEDNQDDA